jgi:hypothetical protein
VIESLRIREDERFALARHPETVCPEVERLLGRDAPHDAVDHPVAGAAGQRPRVFEERDVAAGAAALVRVEEVVDRRVVLVDGLLDEPQPERPGVELDVARCVAGDGGDVMDSFEFHRPFPNVCVVK